MDKSRQWVAARPTATATVETAAAHGCSSTFVVVVVVVDVVVCQNVMMAHIWLSAIERASIARIFPTHDIPHIKS
ncbi:unnamed protein product [Haemonchus placei]|uniref:Secreted protein n=1 Tax=Haemonchus placei TaxID=6290 RepID=A0A0N4WLY4_HAEPC|nr:unnamed protein product [Haemonchus placei]